MPEKGQTPYEALGGEAVLTKLIDTFYGYVSEHPDIAPLFPEDFTETKRKQIQFLTQFLGGPTLYSDEHGHPMLRARHMPFVIKDTQAKAWLECMEEAMEQTNITGPIREYMLERLRMTSYHMVNSQD
ncbi:globin [Alkalihalobacillus alcalophilus ATCC 27647 = CGMCC 1.3604]|uniref:Globin n=1 Tax=Alkalihalobacillus alcalophilus ATCC 27647 = CGMCC 1.3604 TaxID=1218173 RepID=A0A094YUZ0_ALKAL|nr:globin family protein [Alkalihalobacillus alcalophilus]KGA97322.1 globin [Alkalihalobacillus alcalophilus ATCC 27647 = CGMCC 1.3604]MED1561257.1 globin [Alkalihalobacillus alcalophilus]THG90056.1 globin [Alkalihalobacillus alcalophilus ATCC 27647 = CGMCC 1.3604]